MENLLDLTIAVPLRIDSHSREENIDSLVEYFNKNAHVHILIIEADDQARYKLKKEYPNVSIYFIKDYDPVFHRTHYLNELLKMSQTPIVGLWDTDVIVPIEQVTDAIWQIREKKAVLSLPFNGCCYGVKNPYLQDFKQTIDIRSLLPAVIPKNLVYAHLCVGGAILVAKDEYSRAGGENEHFYGWGPEDAERVKRMEILEKTIYQGKGPLFHLAHERGKNSGYASGEIEISNRKELFKICSMHKNELEDYILTW